MATCDIRPSTYVNSDGGARAWASSPDNVLNDDSDSTYGYVAINSDTLSYPGSCAVYNASSTASDFTTAYAVGLKLKYAWSAYATSKLWPRLGARIVNSTQTVVLAAADSGGALQDIETSITTTTPTWSSLVGFSYVNTTANKSTWDACKIVIGILTDKVGGGNAYWQEVFECIATLSYTPAGTTYDRSVASVGSSLCTVTPGGAVRGRQVDSLGSSLLTVVPGGALRTRSFASYADSLLTVQGGKLPKDRSVDSIAASLLTVQPGGATRARTFDAPASSVLTVQPAGATRARTLDSKGDSLLTVQPAGATRDRALTSAADSLLTVNASAVRDRVLTSAADSLLTVLANALRDRSVASAADSLLTVQYEVGDVLERAVDSIAASLLTVTPGGAVRARSVGSVADSLLTVQPGGVVRARSVDSKADSLLTVQYASSGTYDRSVDSVAASLLTVVAHALRARSLDSKGDSLLTVTPGLVLKARVLDSRADSLLTVLATRIRARSVDSKADSLFTVLPGPVVHDRSVVAAASSLLTVQPFTGFPTQYVGLRVWDPVASAYVEICLVNVGNAPTGSGIFRFYDAEHGVVREIYHVDTSDPNASRIRFQSMSNVKSWRRKT